MNPARPAAAGFFFALQVLEKLGVELDRDAVFKRLAEIIHGETSGMDSPEDELRAIERERGFLADPEERKEFFALFADRATLEHYHRVLAAMIVLEFGRELYRVD